MIKFTKGSLLKLEDIFTEQGYTVRYERGNFNSGYCIVEERKIVIINKFFSLEGRINVLLDILSSIVVFTEHLSEKNQSFYRLVLKNFQVVEGQEPSSQ